MQKTVNIEELRKKLGYTTSRRGRPSTGKPSVYVHERNSSFVVAGISRLLF